MSVSALKPERACSWRSLTRCVLALLCFCSTAIPLAASSHELQGSTVANAGEARTFVRVNQLGYRPADAKVGVVMSRAALPETFLVTNPAGRRVMTGMVKPVAGVWGQFEHVGEMDFSRLKTPGRYVVRVGETRSPPFEIGASVYASLPDELLQFMRQQRCGYNPWLDAVCHAFDGRTADGPRPAGSYLDAHGGWHDAGDLLKYLLTSSNATAQMLLAYQLEHERPRGRRPDAFFEDRFNALGQPGANGQPDILDEARWGLEWMLRLHPAPTELYHQVADDRDHIGFRPPQSERADYGWGPGSYRVVYAAEGRPQGLSKYKSASDGVANIAGRYAAAMALGYQVWKDDPAAREFAQSLLRAGREVYALGRAKEGVQQGNSYGAPYRYEETTWADDMEWGAAELYRATGEQRFLEDAKRYARLAGAESWMGREQAGHYQFYPFMNLGHFRLYTLADARLRRTLAGFYREGIERTLGTAAGNPFRAGVPFIWCSNNLMVALATQVALYERMTGDARFAEFSSVQRDWLLGRNPWGVSMFTEVPASGVFPRDVHLMTNMVYKRGVRGGLVDGPVYRKIFQSLRGVSITEPDPLAPFQDDRAVYHDDRMDYSTNEPTMDGTASAILLWALHARE